MVRLSSSWDDEQQDMGELNKLLVPVLIKALDYDIQDAATNTISAVQSGVRLLDEKKSSNYLIDIQTNARTFIHKTNQMRLRPNPSNP